MAVCEYRKCRREFTPNPRNRTSNPQRFCSPYCKWHAWNEANPRPGVQERKEQRAQSQYAQG